MDLVVWLNSFLILLFMGILVQCAQGKICPQGWHTDDVSFQMTNSHCFLYVPSPATFIDAKDSCEMEGGELVSAQSYIDVAIILQIIQVNVGEPRLQKDIWLGINKNEENEWMDLSGDAAYIDWQEGYPEGRGQCVVMFYQTGTMKNKGCHHKSAFICKVPIDSTVDTVQCDDPLLPDFMAIELVGTATTGTVTYPTCADGYIPNNQVKHGSSSISCHGTPGMWNGLENLPQCLRERCPNLELAHLEELTNGGVNYQTIRNFTCPTGSLFDLDHLNLEHISVKCNGQGQWEGDNSEYLFRGTCISTSMDGQTTAPVNAATDRRQQIAWMATAYLSLLPLWLKAT